MSYDRQYRPQLGHWDQHYVLYQDGSLGTTFHISGQNAELMDEAALINGRQAINQLALQSAHPRVQWWEHFTRCGGQSVVPLATNNTWWSRAFDDAVERNCMGGIFRNDLFFTLIVRPRSEVGAGLKTIWQKAKTIVGVKRSALPKVEASFLEEVESIAAKTLNAFAHLGCRQLGMRREESIWYSEVWEAHHLIGNGFFRPIPIAHTAERAGRQIIPARPIFKHRDYQLVAEGPSRWGAILTFLNYPNATHALMHEKLKSGRFDVTVTNSFFFRATQKAINDAANKEAAMAAAGDSQRQAAEMKAQKDDIQSSHVVSGKHHFQVTVRAPSQAQVNSYVYEAQEMISKAGATIARADDKTLKAAFHAQFPGNGKWRTRRGNISSINFASFAALNNVPTGAAKSRWGGPLFYMRTTRNTAYPYHMHVTGDENMPKEDVANWFTTGGMGTGKTSHNARKLVAGGRLGARAIGFDKDCGLAPAFLANDGVYFLLEDGEPSGVSLLRGLEDTPEDRSFIHQMLLGLIESDGHGGVLPSEDGALAQQVGFQMSLPKEIRSIDGIWPMLGSTEDGAGPRLRKWGRSGRNGWAFDGPYDRFDPYAPMLGVDTTALLENPLVCEPMLTLLFYRIKQIVYQRKPLMIFLDECWKTLGKVEHTGSTSDTKRFVGLFHDLSKTIRKSEGAIGLGTQSPGDLLESAMRNSIVQNFPTKEFFGDRNADPAHLIDGFSLSPREFHVIKHVLPTIRHSLLIKRPGGSFIARNDMSGIPGKVAVLSGRRATYDLTLALREKYGGESRIWVPHYEVLAPLIVDDPKLDPYDLVEGRTRHVQNLVQA